VLGTIDPVTGMVTDLGVLDRLVQEAVISRYSCQDLRQVEDGEVVHGEDLAQQIWHALVSKITPGRLSRVHLVQSRDLSFEYCG
jgi:6-pyruvoyltetrahydropterin/6-carboxytetrahydropterin synthase